MKNFATSALIAALLLGVALLIATTRQRSSH
jgi:hypothetical protein